MQPLMANMRAAKIITRTVDATALGIGGVVLGGKSLVNSNNIKIYF